MENKLNKKYKVFITKAEAHDDTKNETLFFNEEDTKIEIGYFSIKELSEFKLIDLEAFGDDEIKEIENNNNELVIFIPNLEKGFVWFENLDKVYIYRNTKENLEYSKRFYQNGVFPFEEIGEVVWELDINETYFEFTL